MSNMEIEKTKGTKRVYIKITNPGSKNSFEASLVYNNDDLEGIVYTGTVTGFLNNLPGLSNDILLNNCFLSGEEFQKKHKEFQTPKPASLIITRFRVKKWEVEQKYPYRKNFSWAQS